MGDGIMAVWGNTPFDFGPQEDATRAVRSALEMIVELRKLNVKWLAEGGTEWKFGIGLNHGQVIVGDIGSPTNKRFATIGDPINLASRIEGLTKEYKVEILIGESVADLVRDKFHLKTIDLVRVKGKNLPVEVFTVLGEKNQRAVTGRQNISATLRRGHPPFPPARICPRQGAIRAGAPGPAPPITCRRIISVVAPSISRIRPASTGPASAS